MYNRKQLLKEIKQVVEKELKLPKEEKTIGTYFWKLHKNDKFTWAIVLAWDENVFNFGDKVLFGKVAFQPNNSMMQCDYDVDWTMPYNKETGEVDDTEVSFHLEDNIEREINWLLDCYESYFYPKETEEDEEIA